MVCAQGGWKRSSLLFKAFDGFLQSTVAMQIEILFACSNFEDKQLGWPCIEME